MNRRQLFAVSFLVLFAALLYFLWQILKPFAMPILWAIIIARLAYPLYRRMFRWTRCRENLSAALVTLLIVFLAILPAAYVIYLGVDETIEAYKKVADWIEAGGLKRLPAVVSRLPVIGTVSQELIGRLIVSSGDLQGSIVAGGQALTAFLLAQVGSVAKNTVEVLTGFMIMLFTLFFLLRDGHRLYGTLYEAIPLEAEHKAAISAQLNATVGAVLKGSLLTALAQGSIAAVTYWLLGISFPVFLGGLTVLLALFPVGGTALVWGPLAVYLLIAGPIWKAVVLTVVGAGLVGMLDNILKPWLIGQNIELPMLFLFFATIGGLAYFGFIGLFLGPVLVGILLAAYQIYRDEFQTEAPAIFRAAPTSRALERPNGPGTDGSPAEEPKRIVGGRG